MNNKKSELGILQNTSRKKKRSNFHHRLNKYFKEQLCTFQKRNEYSPYNINHR